MCRLLRFPVLEFPGISLRVSQYIRLAMTVIVFIACSLTYTIMYPATHIAGIVVLPIVLAAWFFRYRGMWLCILATILVIKLINEFLLHISFWSMSALAFVLSGVISLVVIGLIVAYLRSTVDLVEMTRQKERVAEQQMAQAFRQQQELMQQKDAFLNHIHHELRSPLTVIYGSLQILTNDRYNDQKDFTSFQNMCLEQAMEGCQDLMHLVSQVLEATINRRSFPVPIPQAYSLAQVAEDLFEHGDPRIAYHSQLCLDSSADVMIWADQRFLKQILWNIFLNICIYCAPHPTIHLSVHPSEGRELLAKPDEERALPAKDVPWWCIRVSDSGPGIPPEEIGNLFSPFVRLKRDVAMSTPGSGLGLYISKQLVEAMGGNIWVESSGRQGEGSCFCFTLPNVAL